MKDMALVIPVYGNRRQILKKSMTYHVKQTLDVQIIVVELSFDGSITNLEEFKNIYHVVVNGEDKHKDLCQKESLINIGASYIQEPIQYIMFLDCDVFSVDCDWFSKIRSKLISPNAIVQCCSSVVDSCDPLYSFMSAANVINNNLDGVAHNPGIGWAMHVEEFAMAGGLNPYFIEYSGDSAFLQEMFGVDEFANYPHLASMLRRIDGTYNMKYVDVPVIHINHGNSLDRSYDARKQMVDLWDRSIGDLVSMSTNGLIEWTDPQCAERYAMKHIKWLKNRPSCIGTILKETRCPVRSEVLPEDACGWIPDIGDKHVDNVLVFAHGDCKVDLTNQTYQPSVFHTDTFVFGDQMTNVLDTHHGLYVIMMDSCIVPDDTHWIEQIVDTLKGSDDMLIHGFGRCGESVSYGASEVYGWKSDSCLRGLVWATKKNTLLKMQKYAFVPQCLEDMVHFLGGDFVLDCALHTIHIQTAL